MTRDPFLRLALFAAALAIGLVLGAVAVLVSWDIAIIGLGLGLIFASVASLEFSPPVAEPEQADENVAAIGGPRQRQPEEGTRDFHRIS